MFSIDLPKARPPTPGRRCALVADDDATRRAGLVRHLMNRGFFVVESAEGTAALQVAAREPLALAVLHRTAPDDADSDRTAALIRLIHPQSGIILAVDTASGPSESATDWPVITDPWDEAVFDRCLGEALGEADG